MADTVDLTKRLVDLNEQARYIATRTKDFVDAAPGLAMAGGWPTLMKKQVDEFMALFNETCKILDANKADFRKAEQKRVDDNIKSLMAKVAAKRTKSGSNYSGGAGVRKSPPFNLNG